MKILIIDPYFTGSHKQWAEGYKQHSSNEIEILSLPGKHWKWRMHGAAVTFAKQLANRDVSYDLILATDMLDVAVFSGLSRGLKDIPLALYMHENQLMYPRSENDTDAANHRDNHYGFINYTSCLAADAVFFNSNFHKQGFIRSAETLLKRFPDHREVSTIKGIEEKSELLGLGLDLRALDKKADKMEEKGDVPTLLWNHRWEHDKNPKEFFEALIELRQEGLGFKLVVLGESFKRTPGIFEDAKIQLKDCILHWGYCEDRREYARWLHRSDILPVTSIHDFFGVSVAEAMYCGVTPLLPNRLAYPEHLEPDELYAHLYDHGKFKGALRKLIEHWNPERSRFNNSVVPNYDWHNMAPKYDKRFKDLVNH